MMNKLLMRGFYGLIILVVGSAFAFKIFQPIKVLPRIRLAPGFALTDQNGKPFTSEDVRGQVVIYTFTYTNCPKPCHNITQTLAEIQNRLAEAKMGTIPVKFVIVSFDPDRDTPEALQAYASQINSDTSNWIFATTSNKTLLKTIIGQGFETYYEQNVDGSFSFDPTFILVDGWGIIRGEYRYQTEISNTDRILNHLNVLANEVQNSKGSARLAYEAAHLFLCYAH